MVSYDPQFFTAQTYDAAGNLISKTDDEGNTTQFEHDPLNRLVKTTDASGGTIERAYDSRDNLISLKDPNGSTTRFEYDRNNRLVKEVRPMGQQTIFEYDAAGNRTTVLDAKGQKISYEYDALNRLSWARYFAAGDHTNPVKTVNYTYDKLGNLISYDDGTTSTTYTYDNLQRKTGESVNYGPFAMGYSYAYYANGLKKSFTGPDGITYTYTYDVNNRLSLIGIPGHGEITNNAYQWNSPIKISLPGGATKEFTYDPLMQVKSIIAKTPSQNPLMTYNYDYSPAANITAKNTEGGNYAYQYDKLYRLTQATRPAAPNESYTYDAVGNRLTSADVQGTWSYNENNELLSYDDVSYEYDNNGNMTSKTDPTGITTYTYDVDNRLVQIRNPQSAIYNYYYDPFGRRLWKDVNGVRTYFFYSDEGLIGEYDGSGNEIKTYGYAPDSIWTTNPIYQKIGTNYYWYQNDHLGTPQKIVDTNGRIVWSATSDSFGNIQIQASEIENSLRFPGQYYDAETGLHYNFFRYYDPSTGRYLTKESIGLATGDVNLYSYVKNNPINRIDPLGLHEETEVHLVVIYERALMAGIQPDIAWEIAWASRGVDTSIWTRPESPLSWFTGQLWNEHFHPRDERLERRLRKSCERQDPVAFGKNLHPLVDSFPHLEVNSRSKFYSLLAPFFHLREMDVDLYFGNTDRDLRMLEAVDYWMEEFRKSYYGPPPRPNILQYLNRGGGFR